MGKKQRIEVTSKQLNWIVEGLINTRHSEADRKEHLDIVSRLAGMRMRQDSVWVESETKEKEEE